MRSAPGKHVTSRAPEPPVELLKKCEVTRGYQSTNNCHSSYIDVNFQSLKSNRYNLHSDGFYVTVAEYICTLDHRSEGMKQMPSFSRQFFHVHVCVN